jgi:hypothetical protein
MQRLQEALRHAQPARGAHAAAASLGWGPVDTSPYSGLNKSRTGRATIPQPKCMHCYIFYG